jgi:hypothetical protein
MLMARHLAIVVLLLATPWLMADDSTKKAEVEPTEATADKVTHGDSGYSVSHPLDIPLDTGMFIYSADGQKALRIYGSVRVLGVLDDRQEFHAYDLNLPQIPTGDDDYEDINSTWTIKESRLGFDALLGSGPRGGLMMRMELDWKGVDEAFRIRHMFLRSKHWLVGQSWATLTNVPVMPTTVDGHIVSAGLGIRPVQVRYYNEVKDLKYQIAMEYHTPTLVKPESVDAEGRVVIPALAGRLTHTTRAATLLFSAMVKPNRVQFTGETKAAQNILGYGGVFAGKVRIGEKNRFKFSLNANVGTVSNIADWAYTDIDLIYDPMTGEFENSEVFGGYLAVEHDWSKTLSSTIGMGVLDVRNKDFEPALAFSGGTKPLVNLFYRPGRELWKGLVVGAEVEFARRVNKDDSKSDATRISVLVYYDF